VTASVHDSQRLDGLLNKTNASADVYADSAYRSAESEAKLKVRGLRSRIHQRASPIIRYRRRRTMQTAKTARVGLASSTCLARNKPLRVGRIIRTIGIARAKAKIGLQNLAYNIRRLDVHPAGLRPVLCVPGRRLPDAAAIRSSMPPSTDPRQLRARQPVDDTAATECRRHLHEAVIVRDHFTNQGGEPGVRQVAHDA
jgi:hypothetical protein